MVVIGIREVVVKVVKVVKEDEVGFTGCID